MKLKLYQGATLIDATEAMIKSIDNSDQSFMHVIIVPDRFSLQCEKLVLQLLPQKALFNVRVVTLTRFSVELLSQMGVKIDVLSSGETLLLTAKAIDNVAKDFKSFRKGGIDFCHEINKLISQFKSSGVDPEELMQNANGIAKNKYHDLALIYTEYQALLGGKLDAISRLSLLNDKLLGSKVLKDTKIYFAQFDAFTKVGYESIKAFAKCADEVNISFSSALSLGNDYIYEKDIQQKVTKLAIENGAMVEVVKDSTQMSPQKEAVVKGLYSYERIKCDNKGFFNLYSCQSNNEMIEAVAKLIRYRVYSGDKYKNIQIAVAGLSKVESQIENIFNDYDIPFYIDSSVTADNSILGNLLQMYFQTVIMGYSYDKLVDLLANPLANEDSYLIEKCQHMAIEGKFAYKKYIEKDFKNADILVRIEKCDNTKEFGEIVKEILNRSNEKYCNILEQLECRQELKIKNINAQVGDIIFETIALIEKEYAGKINASEYFKIFTLLLSFRQVSTVPTFVDGVFVGDATESCFGQVDSLIVLNGENLPVVSNDNGLLSDEDLNCNFSNPIEPTIRMLNRRKRFRLFSLLTQAKNRLFVFTQKIDDEGKRKESPTYIKNLCQIFNVEELRAGNVFFSNKSDDISLKLLSAPLNSGRTSETVDRICNIDNLGQLVCRNGSARVTQIEQYFSCPFKHFATYGLKLKEFEIKKFDPRDIGNICHKGAELLHAQIIKDKDLSRYERESLEQFIDDNFDKIINEEGLSEKIEEVVERDSLIVFIKKHMLQFFENIIKELKSTLFVPNKIEYKFGSASVGNSKITLIGKADRIDIAGDYLRVIDYKTGSTGNILKELMYGQKLQLFLYQKFATEKFKKRFGGIFYFDAKFDYIKSEKEGYILKGFAPNEDEAIRLIDRAIEEEGKSDLVYIYKSKKDGSFKGSGVCKQDMKMLSNYAEKITEKALDEINEGYIQPKPHENSCRGCKYASLCWHESAKGFRKLEKKV